MDKYTPQTFKSFEEAKSFAREMALQNQKTVRLFRKDELWCVSFESESSYHRPSNISTTSSEEEEKEKQCPFSNTDISGEENYIKHKDKLKLTNYPLGINNKPTFSSEEKELLTRYGYWLEALADRQIKPLTEAQHKFVKVAQNFRKEGGPEADTLFEKAWIKLLSRREFEKDGTSGGYAYDSKQAWFGDKDHWRNRP